MSNNSIDEDILNGVGIKPLPDDDDDDDQGGTKKPPYGGITIVRRSPVMKPGCYKSRTAKTMRRYLAKKYSRKKSKKNTRILR